MAGVWTIHGKSQSLGNTGLEPLENHKVTNPAFNVGPSSAYQRKGIKMVLDPLSRLPLKKVVRVGPPLTKLSGSAHGKHT